MKHELGAGEYVVQKRKIGDTTPNEVNFFTGQMVKVRQAAAREIVDHRDRVTTTDEFLGDMRANETSTTGNNDLSSLWHYFPL